MKLMILKINFKNMTKGKIEKKGKTSKPTKKRRIVRSKRATLKEKIIGQLTISPFIETACRKLNIPRATIYRWMKEDIAFRGDVEEAIEISNGTINDLTKGKLLEAIKNNDAGMIKYHLSRRHEEYMQQKDVIIENKITLSPEKAAEIARRIKMWDNASIEEEEEDKDEEKESDDGKKDKKS